MKKLVELEPTQRATNNPCAEQESNGEPTTPTRVAVCSHLRPMCIIQTNELLLWFRFLLLFLLAGIASQ